MNPERWQQLDKLFHAALERAPRERAAFIDEACVGDESLRKEVEALLSAHEEAISFIESPALEVEAQALANDQNESVVGQTFGHYKIISSIGAGGMGEVYLAQDTQLGSMAALKLLPAEFTRDTHRVRRFQQEARAASALNHPNIITIHEIGQADGRPFIATEFIDGETLRRRISDFHLSDATDRNRNAEVGFQLSEVLSVGMQVADALAAAHTKGIVHRDIKPENIILVRDSHLMQRETFVKVLDFGIAKLTEYQPKAREGAAATKILLNTQEGVVIGTASYMSPEQARGDKVDARTDIWSLGIVLYEMLTGGVPFGGGTPQDVIASILKEEPPPLPLEVPDRLRWIVEKALSKNREERYQTAREMFSDLRDQHEHGNELSFEMKEHPSPDSRSSNQRYGRTIDERGTTTVNGASRGTSSAEYLLSEIKRHRSAAIIVLTAVLVAVAGMAFSLYKFVSYQIQTAGQNQSQPALPFQTMKIEKLTSTGKAADAAISPDGKYVVHVVDDGDQQSLWLRQVSTSNNVQIIPPADVNYYPGLTFSDDGNYIYYGLAGKTSVTALYQMSVLGGAARKLITDIDSVVTFSPDGKQLAFLRGYVTGETALLVANADGSGERKLASRKLPDFFGANGIETAAWSPDGKVIACPAGSTDTNGRYMTLAEVQVADGSEKLIGSMRWSEVGRVGWLRDGSGLIFTARERAASPSQIWHFSYPGGEVWRITNDLNDYVGVSLTRDSATLATVDSEQVSNIWIAPNENARSARQITYAKYDGNEGVSWTPDGKVVYASRASGNLDLWMIEADGTGQKQLTAHSGNNTWPSLSPDSRYVVFMSDRTGTNHIWRIDIDGNNAKQLTNGDGEFDPQCLPTGGWVIYQSYYYGGRLMKVPLEGGEPVQIIEKFYPTAAISADGRWIACGQAELSVRTMVYPFEGGDPHKIMDFISYFIRWTPDGRAVAYVDPKNLSNISSQPVDGGPPKRLTDFSSDRIFSFAWSHDGKQLALARGTLTQDVVLISNFKDKH